MQRTEVRLGVKAELIGPFVNAAVKVLQIETHSPVTRGQLALESGPVVSDDVSVRIGMVGAVQGLVLYNMDTSTAQGIVGAMMGEPVAELDAMAQSGISELANVITGMASGELELAGYTANITPPNLVLGRGVPLDAAMQRLVVPLTTACGTVQIHLALREA